MELSESGPELEFTDAESRAPLPHASGIALTMTYSQLHE
jgi:hypothetical protein